MSLVAVITVICLLKRPSNVTRIETTIPMPDMFNNEQLPILPIREDEVSHIPMIAQSVTQKAILVSLINDTYVVSDRVYLCCTWSCIFEW